MRRARADARVLHDRVVLDGGDHGRDPRRARPRLCAPRVRRRRYDADAEDDADDAAAARRVTRCALPRATFARVCVRVRDHEYACVVVGEAELRCVFDLGSDPEETLDILPDVAHVAEELRRAVFAEIAYQMLRFHSVCIRQFCGIEKKWTPFLEVQRPRPITLTTAGSRAAA